MIQRLLCILLLGNICVAQTRSAQDLIDHGNASSHRDDHATAIADYQQAIQADPSVRNELLLKLGQQYLWADDANSAVPLIAEYVSQHPAECDARSTLALAYSWANQLGNAARAYREVREQCPSLQNDSLLGEARAERWSDHQAKAACLYRQVEKNGTDAQKKDAAVGLAFTKLAQDDNRAAREDFYSLLGSGKSDPSVVEGLAVADLHLGMPDLARRDISLGLEAGAPRSRSLTDLAEQIESMRSPSVAPSTTIFHDGDGSNYVSGEFRGSFGPLVRSRISGFVGGGNLSSQGFSINSDWGGAQVEHRFSESIAIQAEGRVTDYREANFSPFTGELDAILTPADRTRIDLSAARLTIWDNIAALQHRLLGTFGSAGIDQRITPYDRLSFAVSATSWSDGNRRLVYHFTPAHTFQGVPRLTISLPLLYQSYDRPFQFNLFSPISYMEIAPAFDLSFRKHHIWSFNVGGRLGGQKEGAIEWKPLGAVYGTINRDLRDGWALQATLAHSSSNVASSSGFSRTKIYFSVVRAF